MKQLLVKIKQFLNKLYAFVPAPLPVGMTEFNLWADDIIAIYDLPDNDSVRFALATMILHSDSKRAYVPKRFFGMCALKSMSNQIASGVMQDLKDKQKAAIAAEEAAKTEQPTPPSAA